MLQNLNFPKKIKPFRAYLFIIIMYLIKEYYNKLSYHDIDSIRAHWLPVRVQ